MNTCNVCKEVIDNLYEKCAECRFKNNLSTKKRRGKNRVSTEGLMFNSINCENLLLLRVKILDKISTHRSYDIKNGFDISNIIDFEWCYVLILKQQGKCLYCERNCAFLDYKPRQQNQFSFDRISSTPVTDSTKGHNKNNIVMCCLNCNTKKGQKSVKEYIQQLKREKEFLN